MISKELFSEVLGKVYMLKHIPSEPSLIRWYANDFDVKHEIYVSVNIYELAHKCKEWAFNNRYSILVDILGINNYQISMENLTNGKPVYVKDSYNTIEPEAIFKACQWILDNNGIK